LPTCRAACCAGGRSAFRSRAAPISPQRARVELFLAAFLILFLELAAIRWFGATVVFLTFFSNVVLLACFLGMSVGLLSADRGRDVARSSLPLLALALGASVLTLAAYQRWSGDELAISVTSIFSPRMIYFGTEYRPPNPLYWVVPMWAVAAAFFSLVALVFVGLGQVMGRAFNAIPDRVLAYSVDVLGSLAGIATFAAMSSLELSPVAWFAAAIALMLYLVRGGGIVQWACALAVLVAVAIGGHGLVREGVVFWSPYYKIHFKDPELWTNNMGHQAMTRVAEAGPAYLLPHLLNRDAGNRRFDDVLIIGAGSGNDLAAALRAGALRVDAVEIDPRIASIGRASHPDRPYADQRATLRLDDGRSWVRNTERRYDLAVYALVDSLVLHSGYSSLRLENFLFTREAFEDVKRTLNPDGVFVMYNFYRQGWVVGRLAKLAEETFGEPPLVFSLPYQETIRAGDQAGSFTLLIAGAKSARLDAIRQAFEREGSFWVNRRPGRNESVQGFRPAAPGGAEWARVAPAKVDVAGAGEAPSDDWPQLYLHSREIPWLPIGQGMAAIAVLSVLLLAAFSPGGRPRLNGQMFFLGAGFMLLETKGVVHMALLFGSTWAVSSIVFAAILLMILAANLYVLKARPARVAPFYALLAAGLLLNALVPMGSFLSLPWLARILVSCTVVFLPVFFAGVVFAMAFARSERPGADFGSNIAGIILGGLSENLSLVLGFNHLLFVALAYYLACAALSRRAAAP
jgi:SAM-dependent methyltransferase